MKNMLNDPIEFSRFIEETALNQKKTLLEVLKDYVLESDIDYEQVVSLLSKSLYDKLYAESLEFGLVKREKKNSLKSLF